MPLPPFVSPRPAEDVPEAVRPASGAKCLRCWKVLPTVGSDAEHPELCPRCAAVVKNFPDLA